MCRASDIIDGKDASMIDKLRKARNEIAHHPSCKNDYIDQKKCGSALSPCFLIIKKLHDKLVEIQKVKVE